MLAQLAERGDILRFARRSLQSTRVVANSGTHANPSPKRQQRQVAGFAIRPRGCVGLGLSPTK